MVTQVKEEFGYTAHSNSANTDEMYMLYLAKSRHLVPYLLFIVLTLGTYKFRHFRHFL